MILPRYEVRKCGDSWGAYDRQAERFLMTSTDKSRAVEWVDKLNTAAAAGKLDRRDE